MSAFTDHMEDLIVKHFLQNNAQTPAVNVYLGLFTTTPGDVAGTGVETVYTGYTRIVSGWTNITPAGETKNDGILTFPANTGSSVTIVGAGIFDASTVGNLLIYGDLATQKTLATGDVLSFALNALTLTLD